MNGTLCAYHAQIHIVHDPDAHHDRVSGVISPRHLSEEHEDTTGRAPVAKRDTGTPDADSLRVAPFRDRHGLHQTDRASLFAVVRPLALSGAMTGAQSLLRNELNQRADEP